MSWLDRLGVELRARGVPRRDQKRILLELGDHIACEPGSEARLGDARELAATFADELATSRTRGSALRAFVALACAAVALVVSQFAIRRAGGYPGFDHGLSLALFWPALLATFIGPQVALVAGSLAAWRAIRPRRVVALPAPEVALIARRTCVALAGGLATVAGLELYVINFAQRLPAWWLAMVGGLAAVAGVALVVVWRGLAGAAGIRSAVAGPAGDIFDDLPVPAARWLRPRPWLLAAAPVVAGLAFAMLEARAEHSLAEGIQRGVFEGFVAAVGFPMLARVIGARPDAQPEGGLVDVPDIGGKISQHALTERLVGDDERAHAERVIRDSFAQGRLDLEEVETRLAAVHRAHTRAELRVALTGLLDGS